MLGATPLSLVSPSLPVRGEMQKPRPLNVSFPTGCAISQYGNACGARFSAFSGAMLMAKQGRNQKSMLNAAELPMYNDGVSGQNATTFSVSFIGVGF